MDINKKDNNLIVTGLKDFNLHHIFDCGQCFRFNAVSENSYFGIAKNKALLISQNDDEVIFYDTTEDDFKNIWYDYFDLNRDYSEIKSRLSNDPIMKEAVSYGDGIRILNQDLWEAVISFIISASNNIPRIKGIIERLCENFGKQISYMGKTYYKFKSGTLTEEYIKSLSTPDAKKALMTINGVGNKVSDCILLFGLGRVDSFPIDVWIKRIMEYCYFDGEQSIPAISAFAEKHFGDIGGFAQQYLFFYARENKIGTE